MYSNFAKITISIVCSVLSAHYGFSQKYDYNFINRSTPYGSGVYIKYSDSTQDISTNVLEVPGTVSGSPTLSDKDGNFLGYFNCRNLYDSIGRVAINGNNMAVGFFENYYFPFLPDDEGLGNGGNSAFIPINDSLYYLFYKSAELWIGAPNFAVHFEEKGRRLSSYSDGLYLTKVRVNKNHRLYILDDEKGILLINDLFQYKNLMFCKHANGIDWWLVAPKALDSKAYRLLIYSNGEIKQLENIEFSDNYWRVRSTSEFAFSPNGEYLARLIIRPDSVFEHIFEFFSFNRCEGTVNRILVDSLPLAERYSGGGDVEFSENGRFLYTALGSIILQMDLTDVDFFKNRDTIALWDGFFYFNFLEPIFDALWRLPNGKILVASAISTPFMHYIVYPNLPGDSCLFEQRAITLPDDPLNPPLGANVEELPRFPPFRMGPLEQPCITSTIDNDVDKKILLYPNPTSGLITLERSNGLILRIFNLNGEDLFHLIIPVNQEKYSLSLESLVPGIYFFIFFDDNGKLKEFKKCIKI